MGELVLRDNDIALIRRTVAKDCDPAEFDQFIHICKAVGLDPLRRQIYAFVFGKKSKKADDRRLTVVTAIDGYRAISERSKSYRPDENEPEIEYDETLKGLDNPLGIVKAKVTLWKHAHGDWHKVAGFAHWDEFVPLVWRSEDLDRFDDGVWEDSGKPKYRYVPKAGAKQIVDPSKTGWVKSPRNQIAKCAEAQAHRKGWPNDFAGTFVQEEVDRMHTIDLTASEIAETFEKKERLERIGGPALIVDWMDGNELQRVPYGKFYDAALAFLRTCEGQPGAAAAWRERNKFVINDFWTHDKAACHDLKQKIEAQIAAPVVPIVIDVPAEKKPAGSGRKRMAKVPQETQRLL